MDRVVELYFIIHYRAARRLNMMEDNHKSNDEETKEPKKISLAEAMKRKLQEKKQAQSQGKGLYLCHWFFSDLLLFSVVCYPA